MAALICDGHRVAAIDVNAKAIARAQDSDEARSELLVPMNLSITDRDAVETALTGLADRYGPVRALVNNAGMTLPGTFLEQTDEDWDRIVDVNLKGTFVMAQLAARQMVAHGGGVIVNVSSVSAHGVRTELNGHQPAQPFDTGLGGRIGRR
ncbi:SDR family NAD(P)-dependent oxidoreductase, partial [Mycobacterium malmoense]|uniref:SDR family NAD(P)-dependent oxidoreductase n=1 Tax=Mycobacterium malmoense TaxID=1780 RepID=UPI0021005860